MNFGRINRGDCINVTPLPDPRCSDPAFALANPQICPATPRLVIKPGAGLTCTLGSVQFKAFSVTNGVETDVSADTTWLSSNADIAVIGATSGNCTGTGSGDATIAANYNGMTATATLTVLAASDDGEGCCGAEHVGMMLVVDTSRSMSQAFGNTYPTRLDFAKAAATRWATETNDTKDQVGLMIFDAVTDSIVEDLTSDKAAVVSAIATISQTQQQTAFYDALSTAIDALNASSMDLKVLVLFSDGEDTSAAAANGYVDAPNPVQLLEDFKSQGGIVVCIGSRTSGRGFAFLSLLSTGGFFLNGYPGVETDVLNFMSGLKGYICAGNCTPAGDVIVNKGKLNYNSFINWDVIGGNVDLIGPGLFDFLPGNGLYVDLAGSTAPAYGLMKSKTTFALTAGTTYQLSAKLAGNQRLDASPYSARLRVYYVNGSQEVDLINQLVVINDYTQPFQTYSFAFVAPANVDAYITIQEIDEPSGPGLPQNAPFFGLLLDNVVFDDITNLVNLLTDNFDNENPTYVPPACGTATTFVSGGYAVGYSCYGTGCLDTPPPTQAPDPNALADIESGFTPPQVFNSTKTACVSCPGNAANTGSNLIPAMTGPTTPSGTADASSEDSGSTTAYAWLAFQATVGQPWGAASPVPGWLRYTFPAATVVSVYGLVGLGQSDPGALRSWKFQGSNDGSTWTDLDTQTNSYAVGNGAESKFVIASPQSFTQYRILITALSGSANPVVYRMAMYATAAQQVCSTKSAQSTVSQADADNKAYLAAVADAQSQLNCQNVYTSTQQYTAKCQFSYGQDVTKSATATSFISQADADAIALAAATAAAEAALDCTQSNNTQKITINDFASATPYPSVRFYSTVSLPVTNVQVQIKGFTHSYPQDVRMMLRGPDGTTCLLMAKVGGQLPVSGLNFNFDDSGIAVPAMSLASTTYKPTDGGASGTFYPPAPASPYGTTLSVFNGTDSYGAWTLWVEDDAVLNSGLIANGFELVIST